MWFGLCNLLCLKDVGDLESTVAADETKNGEDTARNDDSVEHVQKPTESEPVTNNIVAKKNSKTAVYIPKDVTALTDMAVKATEVLSNISARKSNARDIPTEDKEWDVCKYSYYKLKEIPDRDLKDDLQIEIQRMVCNTKRNIVRQQTFAMGSAVTCHMSQQQSYSFDPASHYSTTMHAMTTANQSTSFLEALGAADEPTFPSGFTSTTFPNMGLLCSDNYMTVTSDVFYGCSALCRLCL